MVLEQREQGDDGKCSGDITEDLVNFAGYLDCVLLIKMDKGLKVKGAM